MSRDPASAEMRRLFSGRGRELIASAQKQTAERREAVLRHPDLAEKLIQPPLDYARPDQWNGFVPPKWVTTQGDDWVLNDSPQRVALVAICVEAAARAEAVE